MSDAVNFTQFSSSGCSITENHSIAKSLAETISLAETFAEIAIDPRKAIIDQPGVSRRIFAATLLLVGADNRKAISARFESISRKPPGISITCMERTDAGMTLTFDNNTSISREIHPTSAGSFTSWDKFSILKQWYFDDKKQAYEEMVKEDLQRVEDMLREAEEMQAKYALAFKCTTDLSKDAGKSCV
ncbi:uncharacterized protein RCC_03379 [Ramularia collo-cygni]|uniref:Uncharacterized protein n=1 Tax=Ramularia collo-cygni TaxID=112498 RepID=A0A2D3UU52_9PEZI|nr:uncharacterized protein RCC_03379 [Ramularia collo-cygni]CZT17545.1 uncharacterized protein RCC_03379 [Ramularia collo-cygni]